MNEQDISAENSIGMFIHCGKCLAELPPDTSPKEWSQLQIGWTRWGIQVWCNRHECNVVHIDFEGHLHPSESKTARPKFPKLTSV